MKRLFLIISIILLLVAPVWAGPSMTFNPYNPAAVAITGGTVSGVTLYRTEVDGHATGNISATQMSYTKIHNVGQTADSALSLAAFSVSTNFQLLPTVAVAKYLRLVPSATANYNVIWVDGVSCGAGKYFGYSAVVGNEALSCESRKTATGYDLFCSQITGLGACEP